MEKAKDRDLGVTIHQDEIPKSNFFLFIEKSTKVAVVLCCAIIFMTPSLSNLIDKYPKVIILECTNTVSYTHLDVYKRQQLHYVLKLPCYFKLRFFSSWLLYILCINQNSRQLPSC